MFFFPKHNIVREVYNGNLLPAFPCLRQDGEHAGGHCPGGMDQGLSDTDRFACIQNCESKCLTYNTGSTKTLFSSPQPYDFQYRQTVSWNVSIVSMQCYKGLLVVKCVEDKGDGAGL